MSQFESVCVCVCVCVVRMSEVMVRMEERDRNHEATLVAMEKDLTLKQQAMDTLKKKVNGHRSAATWH